MIEQGQLMLLILRALMLTERQAEGRDEAIAAAMSCVARAEECHADALASLDAARRIFEGTRLAVATARAALWTMLEGPQTPLDP